MIVSKDLAARRKVYQNQARLWWLADLVGRMKQPNQATRLFLAETSLQDETGFIP